MTDGFHMPFADRLEMAAIDPDVLARALSTLYAVCEGMDTHRQSSEAPSEDDYQIAMYRAACALGIKRVLCLNGFAYKHDEVGELRRAVIVDDAIGTTWRSAPMSSEWCQRAAHELAMAGGVT